MLLDLNVSNSSLLTWALILAIVLMVVIVISIIAGHTWPWHRP